MSSDQRMSRGKEQSLYKYLPEEWIDFSVRGNERNNYVAKVDHWNSEKLVEINAKRLIRAVDSMVRSFASQNEESTSDIAATSGFGNHLSTDNCDVLTPRVSQDERTIVAKISPLTFYCPNCYKVYQYKSEQDYLRMPVCKQCGIKLSQFRQIYFCKCGYATDRHPARCPKHGYSNIHWNMKKYNFFCTAPGCREKISMHVVCPICNSTLYPKNAFDPSQFFTFSLNLIDLINEKLESYISEKEYGKYMTVAYWLNIITKEDLNNTIDNGLVTDEDSYKEIFESYYRDFKDIIGENAAKSAAQIAADKECGTKYHEVVDSVKQTLQVTDMNLDRLAESILEFDMVKNLADSTSLEKAVEVAKLLNTSANPDDFFHLAQKYGFSLVQACDNIPFITCSYGYTRVENEYSSGVQLHAFKEEKAGRKNIYAIKTTTEGVLFEFDKGKIIDWLIKNHFFDSESLHPNMAEEEKKLWFINNIKPDCIHPFTAIDESESSETYYVYRLIHSVSHLLIRAVADIGGLGKDSLSEYIFPGIPAVLIYCQNSQGFNLGSLLNTFEADFDKWLKKANSIAQKCIYDPICIERQKACTGCLYLNEVSCQHFNKDLDRALVIGHYDRETKRKIVGFWEE